MLLNHLYNLFCGRTREISKSPCCPGIFLNDNDLTKTGFKGSFLYLCSPGDIPGDRVVNHVFNLFCDLTHCPKEKKDALSLYLDLEKHGKKKIKQLKNRQKASLLLSLVEMSDRDVYLFHNIVRGLGRSFTEAYYDLVARLTAKGKPVLYLTDNTTLDEDSETEYSYYQDRTEPWVQHVTLYTANDDTAMKYE
jgi:ABC-type multidrug transport system ATPase subunit